MKHEKCENLAYFPSFFASHAKSSTISRVVVVFVVFEIPDDFQNFFRTVSFPKENQQPIWRSHRFSKDKRHFFSWTYQKDIFLPTSIDEPVFCKGQLL